MMETSPPTLPTDRSIQTGTRSPERGFALIGVLLLLFLLAGMAASLTVSGQTEIKISQIYEAQAKARASAEAGINHATSVVIDKLTTWQADGYASPNAAISALLKGPDGLTRTTARDADNGSLENLGADATQRIPRAPTRRTLTTDESYEARVFDEDDAARGVTLSAADVTRIDEDSQAYTDWNKGIVVRAIGYGPNNAQVTLEAVVGFGAGDPAILVNGELEIDGNAQVSGSSGSVHANGELEIEGSANISGNATASGEYEVSGHPTIGGITGGGYPTLDVPDIHASDRLAEADYILTSAGTMTNQSGTVLCSGSGCASRGWSFGSSTWTVSGDSVKAGTYYVQGDVRITGSPGPVSLSIISEGSITISGNLRASADDPGLFLLADRDIKISGNLTQTGAQAQILVREQIDISGNPTLLGQIIVQDVTSVSNLVTESEFSGSLSLTYDGGLGGASGAPAVVGWRQM
jgi:Tfp pilus assembly protein PilX